MKKTKMTKKESRFKGLFKTKEQTKIALSEIFKKSNDESLSLQVYDLLVLHPHNKELNKVMDDFKPLVSAYEVNELLEPECKIEGWENNPYLRPGIVIGLSLLLIDVCWGVFGEKLHTGADDPWEFDESSKETQILRIMANCIRIELIIKALFDAQIEAVGEEANEEFQKQIKACTKDNSLFETLEQKRLADPKTNLMVFMGYFRTFLEATFFLLYDPEFEQTLE